MEITFVLLLAGAYMMWFGLAPIVRQQKIDTWTLVGAKLVQFRVQVVQEGPIRTRRFVQYVYATVAYSYGGRIYQEKIDRHRLSTDNVERLKACAKQQSAQVRVNPRNPHEFAFDLEEVELLDYLLVLFGLAILGIAGLLFLVAI